MWWQAMEEIAEPLGVSFHLGLSRGEAWLDKPTALMKPPSAAFILANSTVPGLVSSLFPEVLPPTPQAAAMWDVRRRLLRVVRAWRLRT